MSAPQHPRSTEVHHPHDPVEDVVTVIPLVLPLVGAALMFLLAFIAVYMA